MAYLYMPCLELCFNETIACLLNGYVYNLHCCNEVFKNVQTDAYLKINDDMYLTVPPAHLMLLTVNFDRDYSNHAGPRSVYKCIIYSTVNLS